MLAVKAVRRSVSHDARKHDEEEENGTGSTDAGHSEAVREETCQKTEDEGQNDQNPCESSHDDEGCCETD